MFSVFQASAQPRPLIGAALAGAGAGLGLGALLMAAGLGQAAADHHRAARIAEVARGGFSEALLRREAAGLGPNGLRIMQGADRAASLDGARDDLADIAAVDPAAARPARPGAGLHDPVRDLNCLTQAVYFEARGETQRGQAAVAQVVLNRVRSAAYPKTVCGVVYQGAASHGCQFSFVCDGSMRQALEAEAWDRARHVAARALSGKVLAEIGGATHFHAAGSDPAWGAQMLKVAQVGLHVFYRTNPHAAHETEPADEDIRLASAPAPVQPALRLSAALSGKAVEQAVAASFAPPAPAVSDPRTAVVKAADPAPAIRPPSASAAASAS